MKSIISITAAIALATMDLIITGAAFIADRSKIAEMILIVVAFTALAAVFFRRRWLIFIAQNIVSILIVAQVIRYGKRIKATDIGVAIGLIVFGNTLAWLIARSIPQTPQVA